MNWSIAIGLITFWLSAGYTVIAHRYKRIILWIFLTLILLMISSVVMVYNISLAWFIIAAIFGGAGAGIAVNSIIERYS